MLIGAIVCTALAVIVVWLLMRRASVDPKTWSKRNDKVDPTTDD